VVIDTDSDAAEAWVRAPCAETPLRAVSGSGSLHRYYRRPGGVEIRNRQGFNGIRGLDVRGSGGYIVLPPSVHPEADNRSEWLTDFSLPEGLPRFRRVGSTNGRRRFGRRSSRPSTRAAS